MGAGTPANRREPPVAPTAALIVLVVVLGAARPAVSDACGHALSDMLDANFRYDPSTRLVTPIYDNMKISDDACSICGKDGNCPTLDAKPKGGNGYTVSHFFDCVSGGATKPWLLYDSDRGHVRQASGCCCWSEFVELHFDHRCPRPTLTP
jgi:hypothetical protein